MAYRATVTVTDHSDEGVCTSYYEKRLRLSDVEDWTDLTPFDNNPVLVVNGLLSGNTYELQVTRISCDNEAALPEVVEIVIP